VDADLGGANLHTCLGVKPPDLTLSDFITRRVDTLKEVISETGIPGLGLISGAQDVLEAANPKYGQKLRLFGEIKRLDVDCIILDLGAGTGFNIIDFFLIAQQKILTVTPEPTAIENAYRFIKALYYRRLKAQGSGVSRALLAEAASSGERPGLKTPEELVSYVEEREPELGETLRSELTASGFKLVVNQARSERELQIGRSISSASRKYFGVPMEFLGAIPYDDAVWRSVRKRQPVVIAEPLCEASRCISAISQVVGAA